MVLAHGDDFALGIDEDEVGPDEGAELGFVPLDHLAVVDGGVEVEFLALAFGQGRLIGAVPDEEGGIETLLAAGVFFEILTMGRAVGAVGLPRLDDDGAVGDVGLADLGSRDVGREVEKWLADRDGFFCVFGCRSCHLLGDDVLVVLMGPIARGRRLCN